MRQREFCQALILLVIGLLLGSQASAGHRVALVIGNSEYTGKATLPSVARDVATVAESLRARKFRVTTAMNRTRDELRLLVNEFIDSTPINGTALIYYGGHSMMVRDNQDVPQTLLLTVEGNRKAIVLGEVIESMRTSAAKNSIILVDSAKGIPPGYDARRGPAGLNAFEELPDDVWLGFAMPVNTWSEETGVIANRLAATKVAKLEAQLVEATRWRRSTCAQGAVSAAAVVAISPPNTFVPGKTVGDEWVSRNGTVFCWCPPNATQPGFWMSKYETPQSKHPVRLDMGAIGNHRNDPTNFLKRDDLPGTIADLTTRERKAGCLPPNWEYSLPTAQQWEYAARAGSRREDYRLSDGSLPVHANFADRSLLDTNEDLYEYADPDLNDGYAELAPVGSFRPNPWGLHDLFGNVWEQTNDGALRGGSWVSPKEYLTVHVKKMPLPDSRSYRANFAGFRLVIQEARDK